MEGTKMVAGLEDWEALNLAEVMDWLKAKKLGIPSRWWELFLWIKKKFDGLFILWIYKQHSIPNKDPILVKPVVVARAMPKVRREPVFYF